MGAKKQEVHKFAEPAFPLRAGGNGRYLVDEEDRPFFYHADTAWRMCMRLKPDQLTHYLKDRKAKGFNALHVHSINKEKQGMANVYGDNPFDPEADLLSPNEPYWRYLDEVVTLIEEHGFLLCLSAVWFGYHGVGGRQSLSPDNARAYGEFLGARYRSHNNIVWILGGDNDPSPDKHEDTCEQARGIRDAAPHHLLTFHPGPEHSSATFFHHQPWLDLTMGYTYVEAYLQIAAEYQCPVPHRPIVLAETGYEGESNTGFVWTPYWIRRQMYWALLSGACGCANGNGVVWHLGEGWEDALDMEATLQMSHVRSLFESLPWWTLVPDVHHNLVTRGYGNFGRGDYAGAAVAEDGSCGVVYLPVPGAIEVDMECFSSEVAVRWMDPTSGVYLQVSDQPLPSRGTRSFQPPPRNSKGEGDWLLVFGGEDSTG